MVRRHVCALFLMACLPQLLAAQVISIDFNTGVGSPHGVGPFVLAPADVAGVIPAANWNQRPSTNSTGTGLRTNTGATTTAQVAVSGSTNEWSVPDTPNTPNGLMMKGYLDSGAATTTTVAVTGLPAPFSTAGFRVIVYFDGDNEGNDRGARYTIGTTSRRGVDAANANFTGTFRQVVNDGDQGNYIIFTGLTGTSFTLTGTPDIPTTFRAPINALQIEVIPEPGSIALASLGMAGIIGYGRRLRRRKDGAGLAP